MTEKIFIRTNIATNTADIVRLHDLMIKQMETGVVILPEYCEFVYPTDAVLDRIMADIELERKACERAQDQYAVKVIESIQQIIEKRRT